MALEPTWQSNYVDLSDELTIRFGAWCAVCGARYVSAGETLDPALPHSPPPGSAAAHAIEEAKYRVFVEFDTAFREITIECYRCEHPACPDCWDEDKRMCGACVQTHGLARSPHRGIHAAPLADGRLRRAEPGQFSEAARPSWLNELLAAQPPGAPAGGQPGTSGAMWQGLSAIAPGQQQASEPKAAPVASIVAPSTSALVSGANASGLLAAEPMQRVASVPPSPGSRWHIPPAPPASPASVPRMSISNGSNRRIAEPGPTDTRGYTSPEGKATSNMVECPRCHTANYDFVTRCTVCQLQLIQICPLCERLNPGHATSCEGCGSPLDRPSGWSEVRAQVTPLSPDEVRRRLENALSQVKPSRRRRLTRPKRADSGRLPANDGQEHPAPSGIPIAAAMAALPAVAALAGAGAMAMPSQPAQASSEAYPLDGDGGAWNGALVTLERVTTAILLLAIVGLVGVVLAAELSPGADAAIKTMIHVDIHEAIANFWSWLQTLWHRYYHT